MTPTKEQQAQEYAEKLLRIMNPDSESYQWDKAINQFDAYDIDKAFRDGYTACEQSQWRSVDEELPEDDETVLTYSNYGPVLAYYSEQDKMWFAYGNYGDINPTHWKPITPPTLPDTNAEKI